MAIIGAGGMTVQLWVADGSAAGEWYRRLFQREPDFKPAGDDSFNEWIFTPGHWEIHIVEAERAGCQRARLRFGVEDIDAGTEQLTALGIEVSRIEGIPGVVRYCNFDDPWGNRLGLYQDLSRFPQL